MYLQLNGAGIVISDNKFGDVEPELAKRMATWLSQEMHDDFRVGREVEVSGDSSNANI